MSGKAINDFFRNSEIPFYLFCSNLNDSDSWQTGTGRFDSAYAFSPGDLPKSGQIATNLLHDFG